MKRTRLNNIENYIKNIRLLSLATASFILLSSSLCAQLPRDSIVSFDSVTVENDTDIDSIFFTVFNRWGQNVDFDRNETDSVQNYWNYLKSRKDDNIYFTLGNTGSPAISAYWQGDRDPGFDHGIHHMDLHRIRSDEMKYFGTDRAFTSLHYNQSPQQTKSATNVLFGRAFDRKSGITIQYDRVNDLGEFSRQRNRNTSVGAGIYLFPSNRTKIYFSCVSNNFTLEENGGIQSETFFDDPTYDDRSLFPVNRQNADSEWKEREARITASWKLGSTNAEYDRGMILHYDGIYGHTRYKYADPDTSFAYYRDFVVHEDGHRAWMKERKFSNFLGIGINYGNPERSKFAGRTKVGLEYSNFDYEQSDRSTTINTLALKGELNQTLSQKINVQGQTSLFLTELVGDYGLQVHLNIQPIEDILISGFVSSKLVTPTGFMRNFASLGTEVYSNTFNQMSFNSIGGRLAYEKLGVSLEIKNTLLGEYVFVNSEFKPQQIGGVFNIFQLKGEFNKEFGSLYMRHNIYLQNSSDDRVPLPNFMSKHYVGMRSRLFKNNLILDTGFEGVIIPNNPGYGYFPLTGQYYPTNNTVNINYTADGILGFHIDNFKFYFRFENLHLAIDEQPRFMIEDYPLYDFRLRIGIRWLLRG